MILKEIKQLKETLDMTPADRTDIIEEMPETAECTGGVRAENDERRGNPRCCP